ncbi:hypothetical protein [Caldovatus aquaticus]|jgi:predicted regulator of Ras-like GTPase activity (Roadblock/LC7/MglB family)|uniref:Chemotaxis protein n=1 Tax=Caldovatus aquaticus TaxID=2865671 RepID=A0ABS7F0I1_9PROT|nr:hypothetical protein [Caldovatus aquaticus]MBW8269111.1 hypothetical protein [Caldovatus aquaticus]
MPRTEGEPHQNQAAVLRELRQAVGELRADLLVTQAALASLAADVARVAAEPDHVLGALNAKVLGFAEAAARGLPPGAGRPEAVTAAAARFADWAESFLRNRE